jgi:DNA recombination protein RmuC
MTGFGWWVLALSNGVLAAVALALAWGSRRSRTAHEAAQQAAFAEVTESLRAGLDAAVREAGIATERALRAALDDSSRAGRTELGQGIATMQQTLLAQTSTLADTQVRRLGEVRATVEERLDGVKAAVEQRLDGVRLTVEQRLDGVRGTVEQRLITLQDGNEKRLEQMRATVDEKLHATLELRLGESFKQVAERLDLVHRGLGDMQVLARDVGSLSKVLGNVKTRGLLGEMQLAALLEQVFTPDQYAANVETIPGSGARVEFALKLPGRRDDGQPLWLPIDAKFPREDYERLLDAQDRADRDGIEAAARALEMRLRDEAKQISTKYLGPPHTTDFAILFLPTEGLYAEALRRPGLVESLQRHHRVSIAGPTTLHAMLSSLQMGFRTLALEKRSSEVWRVLGAVKTEFGKFGEVLAKTRKKLEEAQNTIDAASTRTRAMDRQLRDVEALPESETGALLGALAAIEGPGDEAADGAETPSGGR